MKVEIKIPTMGESISEVTIGQIFVTNGRGVKIDAELVELETDKVNQVLYSPQSGVVELKVKSGETVKIGQVIGLVETEGAPSATLPAQPEVKVEAVPADPKPILPKDEIPIRKMKESFISDMMTPVSKPIAPVVKQVVVAQTSPAGPETRKPMSKIRKVIANRLVEAQHTTAMLTTFNEVDMSQVMQVREKEQALFTQKYGTKLGYMSFFVEAVISALKAYPALNSYIDGEDIVERNYYNIGMAVGTEKGTFVPVLRNCDKLSFGEIELAIDVFAKKAKEGTLIIDDLQGGGFTITNGGVYGSLLSTPILNAPQSGILGIHKIEKRPVVVNDQIVIRPMMYLALTYDHRIVDGKESVAFLVHIKNVLEDTSRLLLNV